MTGHLSNLVLDQLSFGAAPAAAAAHLAACPRCRERANESAVLRAELPPALRVDTLARLRRRRLRRWLSFGVLTTALATVMLVVQPGSADGPPLLAVKGDAALEVYAQHARRVTAVGNGAALAAGDEIRFAVSPGGARHVLIVSLDGRGQATIYVPYGGPVGLAIDPVRRSELPGSIVLDDAPGPERIFAIFTQAPIHAAVIAPALTGLARAGRDALRTTPTLALPFPAVQRSLWFEKEVP